MVRRQYSFFKDVVRPVAKQHNQRNDAAIIFMSSRNLSVEYWMGGLFLEFYLSQSPEVPFGIVSTADLPKNRFHVNHWVTSVHTGSSFLLF
jgi:hypothetical protein